MLFPDDPLKTSDRRFGSFYNQKNLGRLLDLALPPVVAFDGRHDVDACGHPLFQECVCQIPGACRIRDRDENHPYVIGDVVHVDILDTRHGCGNTPGGLHVSYVMPRLPGMPKLWQSGMVFTVASFAAGLLNYAFQGVIGRQLPLNEYGLVNAILGFVGLFSLPLAAIRQALTHHIAQLRASGDEARLRGLFLGGERLLLRATVLGCLIALVLVYPLATFFHIPRVSLVAVALAVVFANLWTEFANGVFFGMAWFGRLGGIIVSCALARVLLGALGTRLWPGAEPAILASLAYALVFASLFLWRHHLARPGLESIRPSGREFTHYAFACTAFVLGQYAFLQGDLLVAQRHIAGDDLGLYTGAGQLGRALVYLVSPFLMVLFQARSAHRHASAVRDQIGLLMLYAAALVAGAFAITFLRGPLSGLIFGRAETGAAQLVGPFTAAMVSVGLVQAVGTWALASRWFKITYLFGALGIAYWLMLLFLGRDAGSLLRIMLFSSTASAIILSICWIAVGRRRQTGDP